MQKMVKSIAFWLILTGMILGSTCYAQGDGLSPGGPFMLVLFIVAALVATALGASGTFLFGKVAGIVIGVIVVAMIIGYLGWTLGFFSLLQRDYSLNLIGVQPGSLPFSVALIDDPKGQELKVLEKGKWELQVEGRSIIRIRGLRDNFGWKLPDGYHLHVNAAFRGDGDFKEYERANIQWDVARHDGLDATMLILSFGEFVGSDRKLNRLLESSGIDAYNNLEEKFDNERFDTSSIQNDIKIQAKYAKFGGMLSLDTYKPNAWDRILIVKPYTDATKVDDALGFSWISEKRKTIGTRDDINLLIFLKDNAVALEVEVTRDICDFENMPLKILKQSEAVFVRRLDAFGKCVAHLNNR